MDLNSIASLCILFAFLFGNAKCSQQIAVTQAPNLEEQYFALVTTSSSFFNGVFILVSDSNSAFEMQNYIHNDTFSSFGSAIACGTTPSGGPSFGLVSGYLGTNPTLLLYNLNTCNSSTCTPNVIVNFPVGASYCTFGKFLAAGNAWAAAACSNNLSPMMNKHLPFLFFWEIQENGGTLSAIGPVAPQSDSLLEKLWSCNSQTEIMITAMSSTSNFLAHTLCGICPVKGSTGNGLNFGTTKYSGFVVVDVVTNGAVFAQVNGTGDCPMSIAVHPSGEVVALGFPKDNLVQVFYSNGQLIATLTPPTGASVLFGQTLDFSDELLTVSDPGNTQSDTSGAVYFYGVSNTSGLVSISVLGPMVPIGTYLTSYSFGYTTALTDSAVLIVSNDAAGGHVAIQSFTSCPSGQEWGGTSCIPCPAGRYKSTASFDMCRFCPDGTALSTTGATDVSQCNPAPCQGNYCPPGSTLPLLDIPVDFSSGVIPNLQQDAGPDFETTFYISTWPWYLVLCCLSAIVCLFVFFPSFGPRPAKWRRALQKLFIAIRIYGEPEEEKGESTRPREDSHPVLYFEYEQSGPYKKFEENSKNRNRNSSCCKTIITPPPISLSGIISSCNSLWYFLVMILLFAFLVQFNSIDANFSISYSIMFPSEFTDHYNLNLIDTPPMLFTVDLYGYNGKCVLSEFSISTLGCHKPQYTGNCDIQRQAQILSTPPGSLQPSYCQFSAYIPVGTVLDVSSQFMLFISAPLVSFQRLIYNISTQNTNLTPTTGNSYLSGVVQPDQGRVIVSNATIDALSLNSYVGDCDYVAANSGFFSSNLVLSANTVCTFDPSSFKEISFLSNSTTFVDPNDFYRIGNGFTFAINLQKANFFRYISQGPAVSSGTMVTLILFAVLDINWLLDIFNLAFTAVCRIVLFSLLRVREKMSR